MRTLLATAAVLAALHLLAATAVFFELPSTIPIHFDAQGQADGFASASVGSWFMLWFVSLGLFALFGVAVIALPAIPPRLLSLPRKTAFLSLPEEARRSVLLLVSAYVLGYGLIAMALLFSLHLLMAAVALGALGRLPVAALWVGLALSFALVIAMIWHVQRAIDREVAAKTRQRAN